MNLRLLVFLLSESSTLLAKVVASPPFLLSFVFYSFFVLPFASRPLLVFNAVGWLLEGSSCFRSEGLSLEVSFWLGAETS